jgi:hypothetical protein
VYKRQLGRTSNIYLAVRVWGQPFISPRESKSLFKKKKLSND